MAGTSAAAARPKLIERMETPSVPRVVASDTLRFMWSAALSMTRRPLPPNRNVAPKPVIPDVLGALLDPAAGASPPAQPPTGPWPATTTAPGCKVTTSSKTYTPEVK